MRVGVQMQSYVFTKGRSFFWLCIRENDDGSYNCIVSNAIREILGYHFPEIFHASPTGWKQGGNNTFNLWVPLNNLEMINVEAIKQWGEFAGNQCVWLAGDGYLDFCIAADFNFKASDTQPWPRTTLGEAEYWLKYHRNELSDEVKQTHINNVCLAIMGAYNLLPLAHRRNSSQEAAIVSSIPDNDDSGKLAPALAWYTARQAGLGFVRPTLSTVKPSMKNLTSDEKKLAWESLLNSDNATSLTKPDVYGKEVVIVDDLYQSGTTMQAYAKYLKAFGALRIFGIACVKSMKNSDNK